MPQLCIFSGAAHGKTSHYQQEVQNLSVMLATRGFDFIYGGGRTGLMGVFASNAVANGGHVIGVIPQFLEKLEIGHKDIHALKIVDSMHERKAMMYENAQGFIILPGGLGTLDEWMEVMTWNQLGLINAPIFVLNINAYWQSAIDMLDHANNEGFIHNKGIVSLHIADTADRLVDLIDNQFS